MWGVPLELCRAALAVQTKGLSLPVTEVMKQYSRIDTN